MKQCPDCQSISLNEANFCGKCGRDIKRETWTPSPFKLASTEATQDPICPHCDKPIGEVQWRSIQAVNAEYVFMCPACQKVIGVGVRKDAWIN